MSCLCVYNISLKFFSFAISQIKLFAKWFTFRYIENLVRWTICTSAYKVLSTVIYVILVKWEFNLKHHLCVIVYSLKRTCSNNDYITFLIRKEKKEVKKMKLKKFVEKWKALQKYFFLNFILKSNSYLFFSFLITSFFSL